ncbi:MAG: RNA polymerase factor sigma-54 [Nitrospinae bacterium]|nr:RNA polymerase factor sigma-54 [Nitrospinota bacterium]
MAFETKISLRQNQRLVMTQMLQQAIKLLPLARMELIQTIQKTMEENPLLDESATDENEDVEEDLKEVGPDHAPIKDVVNEGIASVAEKYTEDIETPTQDPEVDFETFYQDGFDRGAFYDDYTEKPSFEGTLKSSTTLSDHLFWQLGANADNEEEKIIGYHIIGNLNSEGYLLDGLEDIAEECGTTAEEAEEVLTMIQNFDPPGIGARSLKECLLIQLRQKKLDGGLSEVIINDHMEHLRNNRLDLIAKSLNVEIGVVLNAVKILRKLDPKPGLKYAVNETQYIIPDVYVHKDENGEYKVTVNDEGMPKLRISPYYRQLLEKEKEAKGKSPSKDFMEDKFRSAIWLIKSIEQRRQTIYKTACSVVKFQKEFLDKGYAYLKPLVLRDVATDIGMHESTISRVTTNKYIHTPRGIFELKFFFHSGLGTYLGSSNMSSLHVKNLIREIVVGEDPKNPVTDEEIMDALSKKNIRIARRTIAKYRKELKIGSASQRRRNYELNQ